jgi:hypothetical protein
MVIKPGRMRWVQICSMHGKDEKCIQDFNLTSTEETIWKIWK